MTPEQAAFCVRHPDHPAAQELTQRDSDFMMLDPKNQAALKEVAQRWADAIDEHVFQQVYGDIYGRTLHE